MERTSSMRKMTTIFTVLAAICSFALSAAAYPPSYTGKIILESKHVLPGQTFTVKIWLANNNSSISSVYIPLKFNSTYLTCTYVDFTGSMKVPGMNEYQTIESGMSKISLIPEAIYPLPSMTADSGLIATLYFTLSPSTPDIILYIDSLNRDSIIDHEGEILHYWERPQLADTLGEVTIIPDFYAAKIIVGNATGIDDEKGAVIPDRVDLMQNFPNPFNPITTISFALPEKARVDLNIYNVLGQKIESLAGEEYPAGAHTLSWDATAYPSGVYFYRLSVGNESLTKKMILMK